MQTKSNVPPMNFFVNRAMGVGNSGIEHAEFYRAHRFDEAHLPYRLVFVQLIKNLHEAMDKWHLKNQQVVNMYEYFVLGERYLTDGVQQFYEYQDRQVADKHGVPLLLETITSSGIHIVETMIRYQKPQDLFMASKVELFEQATGDRKVTFNFYRTNHQQTVIRNIHLFKQNGKHLFFWNEIQVQRYFFAQLDLAFGSKSNWFLDRGEESEVALFYPKFPNSKVIEMVHADHLSDRNDPNHPLWNNYYEYSLTHLDQIDLVISATEIQTQDFLKDFPNDKHKFITIPVGGVSDNHKPIKPKWHPGKQLHLVTASRLAGEKHIDIAVRAVAKIKQQGYDVTFDIYGIGSQNKIISDIIATSSAGDYIHLKGFSSELEKVYPKYDAFLTASFSEGFGLSTVEALNAGLPVIGYNARFGSLEMIHDGQNGFLEPFKVGDDNLYFNVNSLARGIKRLLDCDYPQVCQATQTTMEQFRHREITRKWEEVVHALRISE
ncbi:glycosyltransferase [Fructilactobacillus carniphilus]|uniref:Glycosyltransferase n=1 Tax=Fructilactobacillus carniphilus TaxID=2940297 RepID=A0ABY5BUK9_9LACO|nr:glycosyltransferase [Fructilactobacillus carniphilus]USS90027.1 glycosyltransferase [Fructilactobacillus carniphilus]